MERLTKRIGNSVAYSDFNSNHSDGCYEMMDNCLQKLADYEDKQEQGFLRELPCSVNDEFWVIAYSDRKVTHVRCTGYCIQEDVKNGRKEAYVWIDSLENDRDYWKLSFDDFKIQCFTTEAEAEEALARMKGE